MSRYKIEKDDCVLLPDGETDTVFWIEGDQAHVRLDRSGRWVVKVGEVGLLWVIEKQLGFCDLTIKS